MSRHSFPKASVKFQIILIKNFKCIFINTRATTASYLKSISKNKDNAKEKNPTKILSAHHIVCTRRLVSIYFYPFTCGDRIAESYELFKRLNSELDRSRRICRFFFIYYVCMISLDSYV